MAADPFSTEECATADCEIKPWSFINRNFHTFVHFSTLLRAAAGEERYLYVDSLACLCAPAPLIVPNDGRQVSRPAAKLR